MAKQNEKPLSDIAIATTRSVEADPFLQWAADMGATIEGVTADPALETVKAAKPPDKTTPPAGWSRPWSHDHRRTKEEVLARYARREEPQLFYQLCGGVRDSGDKPNAQPAPRVDWFEQSPTYELMRGTYDVRLLIKDGASPVDVIRLLKQIVKFIEEPTSVGYMSRYNTARPDASEIPF